MRDFRSPPPEFAPQVVQQATGDSYCTPIVTQYPELRDWNLKFYSEDVPREVPHDWSPESVGGEVLCAVAAPLTGPGGKPDFTQTIDLLPALHDARELLMSFNSAARVFVFSGQTSDSIDLLNPTATQLLLEQISDKPTAQAVSIQAAFMSLGIPGLLIESSCPERDCWPWSPLIPDAFVADHGYALVPRLPSLVADTGADAARVRQDFWSTIVRLLQENLWQPLGQGEQTRGVVCALSVAGQEPLRAAALHYGDIVPAYRALVRPCCTPGLSGSLAARFCASIAALEGKRAFVEIQATADQDGLSQQSLPRVLPLLGQGINGILMQRTEYSSRHETHRIEQPWDLFAEITARYCYALSQGQPAARIGVLLSTRSMWAHHHPRGHRFTRWVDEDLHDVTRLLDELHFDYLLLPEDDLLQSCCDADTLLCGTAKLPLEMIVVPGVTTLSWPALRKLEEFVASGGKVAFLGLLPRWSENGRDEELEKRISKMTMVIAEDIYDAYAGQGTTTEAEDATIGYPITRENEAGGRLSTYQPRLNEDRDDARLRVQKILKESLAADLETQSPHIRYTRRVLNNGDVYFLLNEDADAQRINVRLRPSRPGRPYTMDVWSGAVKPLHVWMQYSDEEGDGLNLELELAAHEARLIWVQTEPESEAFMPHAERANFIVEEFDGAMARGYATENGEPEIAVREHGKLIWHTAPPVTIPQPLLLIDKALFAGEPLSFRAPTDWAGCRVFLEVAGASELVEAIINGQSCGARLAVPYRFEVTQALSLGGTDEIRLRSVSTPVADDREQLPSARLVAYPTVAITL